jgi:hypothetical protein
MSGSLASNFNGALFFPYAKAGLANNLQTLEISELNVNFIHLKSMIEDPGLHGLKELVVREAYFHKEEYDHPIISEAISANLPNLRRLEWTRNDYADQDGGNAPVCPFGSFKELINLVDLTVDWALILPVPTAGNGYGLGQPIHILQSEEYLPQGLQALHISEVDVLELDELCRKFTDGLDVNTAVRFIRHIANPLHVRKLEVSIRMEHWMMEGGGVSSCPSRYVFSCPSCLRLCGRLELRCRCGVRRALLMRSCCTSHGLQNRDLTGEM